MTRRVLLGEAVPSILADLTPDERDWASRHLVVPTVALAAGRWDWRAMAPPAAGVLVLDGLLAHRVTLAGQVGADLVGPKHVVQPWRSEPKVAAMMEDLEWRVLAPTTLAVLDRQYLTAVARIPALAAVVAGVSVDHSSMAACQMAILAQPFMEDRVLMLFWHMAERWGRVTPAGVVLDLPGLTQSLLAEAVAAGRQSVSRAISLLRTLGLVLGEHGVWTLPVDPSTARAVLERHRTPVATVES